MWGVLLLAHLLADVCESQGDDDGDGIQCRLSFGDARVIPGHFL